MSRLSRALEPLDSLCFVDSDAGAIKVAETEIVLRICKTRLGISLERCEILIKIICRLSLHAGYHSGSLFALFFVLPPHAPLALFAAVKGSETPRASQNSRFPAFGSAGSECNWF
jgi:hypothetical protein